MMKDFNSHWGIIPSVSITFDGAAAFFFLSSLTFTPLAARLGENEKLNNLYKLC